MITNMCRSARTNHADPEVFYASTKTTNYATGLIGKLFIVSKERYRQ